MVRRQGWGQQVFGFFRKRGPIPPATAPTVGYRVFTDRFDEEISAAALAKQVRSDPAAARSFAEATAEFRSTSGARTRAERRAMAFQTRWRGGHGLGDRPLITLLTDHSGSMRGVRAFAAALAADALTDMLGHERIRFEILGFTTRSWHGGQSRTRWQAVGSPPNPGRLCDLQHIVYHAANEAGRGAGSQHEPLLLVADLLKENVDGEALAWAHKRASAQAPTTWICVMLSDGVPMDDATVAANGLPENGWYLWNHLNQIAHDLDADPSVRLGAIGLEYEPTETFRHRIYERTLENVPLRVFDLLEMLIWPEERGISEDVLSDPGAP
jgi:cobaltochelatase CobT